MKQLKPLIIILLLISTIVMSFIIPSNKKYEGTDFISNLKMPYIISNEWKGKDISAIVNQELKGDTAEFISEALAYEYVNKDGEKLFFIILDAANFHHPKACFTSAGYKIKELNDTKFHVLDRTFKVHSLYTERSTESFLSFYWISIDKKIVHQWVEQKLKQLYFSLFNKKRVGLMIRIDIPTKEENIKDAMSLARQFINDLGPAFPPEKTDYIFGKK